MNRTTRILGLSFALLFGIAAAQDFRGHTWGDTIDQVMANETMDFLYEVEGVYFFEGRVANLPAVLVYEFIDNQLVSGSYMYESRYTNKNNHIGDYHRINEILERNYGRPDIDRERWDDTLFRNTPSDHGLAVSIGHVTFYSQWVTDRTEISHMLGGDSYEIQHLTRYLSVELASERDRVLQDAEDAAF